MTETPQPYPEVVHTRRFVLYPLRVEHAGRMFEGLSDARSYAFIPEMPPVSVSALAERYRFMEGQFSPDCQEVWLNWVIASASESKLYGYVQFTITPDERHAFVAYLVFPHYQRQGIAAEAVAAAMEQVVASFELDEIVAAIDTRNVASIALVESLGFVLTRFVEHADEFKGSVSDEFHYSFRVPGKALPGGR